MSHWCQCLLGVKNKNATCREDTHLCKRQKSATHFVINFYDIISKNSRIMLLHGALALLMTSWCKGCRSEGLGPSSKNAMALLSINI